MSWHRGLRRTERTTWIHAVDTCCGPRLAAERRRQSTWRCGIGKDRAGGADGMVENQAQTRTRIHATHHGSTGGGRSCGTSGDWDQRGGASHSLSAVRPELGTGMAGIYASLSPMAWNLFPFCLCPHLTIRRDRRRRQGTNQLGSKTVFNTNIIRQ